MIQPSKLWIDLLPKRGDPGSPSLHRRRYCLRVLELLSELHPDLYEGRKGTSLSIEDAKTLVRILRENSPGHVVKHRISYLARGLEKGALELDWDVAIPEPPVVIPRDKACFAEDGFASLPSLYRVEEAFLAALKGPPPDTQTGRVGQLLVSAILYGGLIEKRWLAPWVEALSAPHCTSSFLWLDLVFTSDHHERLAEGKRSIGKHDRPEWEIRRRWFADPLSHSLIIRLHNLQPLGLDAHHSSPFQAINNFLMRILPGHTEADDIVEALLKGSSARLCLQVPPFLVAYARGQNKSVSLSIGVWKRLVTGMRITDGKMNNQQDLVPPSVADFLKIGLPQHALPQAGQEQLLKEILRYILPSGRGMKRKTSESKAALENFDAMHRSSMSQILRLLLDWCIDLLTHYSRHELVRRRIKSSIRASSVRRYLHAIGKKLVAVADNVDILSLESDELHDIYRRVIDLCPTHHAKQTAGERLACFHEFLMARFGVQSVDFSDLLVRSAPAELGVSANLVSPAEFDLIKKALTRHVGSASRIRRIQYLIAILGFRCGLRRREALKLRIIDLKGNAKPELLIRSNQYAYVKSTESVRRIPLYCLLEPDELELLLSWRRDRLQESDKTDNDALLFCAAATPTSLLPEDEIFQPIMQAVRQVTGDTSLEFHHLRHSFTTWLLLRLFKDFPPEARKDLRFLDHSCFNEKNCVRLRKAILGNQRLGRQALYATALLCGHGSPDITLLHYFHLADWLLGYELATEYNQPTVDSATIRSVTGLQEHTIYYARKKRGDEVFRMSTYLDRLNVPAHINISDTFQKMRISPIADKRRLLAHDSIPFWRRVEAIVHSHQNRQCAELASRHGFNEQEVRGWYENAMRLSSMQTRRGKPRHLNAATLRNNPDFRFPVLPHLRADREMAERVLNSYEQVRTTCRIKTINDGVSCFLTKFNASESSVSFKTPSEAKSYLQFLKIIGIPYKLIRVIRIIPRSSRKSELSEQISFSRQIGVPCICVTVKNLHPTEYSKAGEIHIQVINPTPSCKIKAKASYGYRYAMYLVGIIYGLPKTNDHSNIEERGAV